MSKTHFPRLVVACRTLNAIERIVRETPEGLETGVTLFGKRGFRDHIALFSVGPGKDAVHTPTFHEPDIAYVNSEYARLRRAHPSLDWIGSLHVHPSGMPQLSGHDRSTVAALFGDPSLGLQEFVAGIIQRRGTDLAIYPYVISREDRAPWLVPLEIVSPRCSSWRAAEKEARRPPVECDPAAAIGSLSRPRRWRRLLRIDSAIRTSAARLRNRRIQVPRKESHE